MRRGCGRAPQAAYTARPVKETNERKLSDSKRDVDEGKPGFAMKAGHAVVSRTRPLPRAYNGATAREMRGVENRKSDSACLLTPPHRPSRLQLMLPMADEARDETKRCPGLAARTLGDPESVCGVLDAAAIDNGMKLSDETGIAAFFGERRARRGRSTATRCAAIRRAREGAMARPASHRPGIVVSA